MRLRITKDILEKAKKLLITNAVERASNPVTYKLSKVLSLREGIDYLDRSSLFKTQINALKTLSFYESTIDTVVITKQEFVALSQIINNLNVSIQATIEALSNIIYEDNQDLISIKIPNPNSFKDIVETSKSLDKIFNQTIFHEDIKGNYKIVNFDTGSYWIDILLNGGATVLHLVAALSWGGAVVYKKIQEGRLLKEQVTALKLSNEATREINEKNKIAENAVAQNEAEFIYNKFYKGQSPEQIERIKLALNELAKLYFEGAEIYPNIEAPTDLKKEFPDVKSIESIKSKIKALPSKK
ncbi:MAG TPA: hypothetical protein PLL09_08770 [Flavobacterium sp.]|uniref:hypothetical protein n=1 Tax=unclassified Flavobacterium TaxID=196869 RepID=UPI0025B8EA6E|nr:MULTISPECIES: hypothetical protein [unclassified Flavobacterium]HRE77904.1 hypothetical protein [Flavobacterium sp.]